MDVNATGDDYDLSIQVCISVKILTLQKNVSWWKIELNFEFYLSIGHAHFLVQGHFLNPFLPIQANFNVIHKRKI